MEEEWRLPLVKALLHVGQKAKKVGWAAGRVIIRRNEELSAIPWGQKLQVSM
jgi:hypothetical protein